ncbi:Uncharacterised protein [Mycobacteroides abscessus subsp. abscessus]|nr:Uncharacterised protein [Mycobacteroides abscessus subsp. abscessus]
MVRIPMRHNRSTKSSRCGWHRLGSAASSLTDNGARNCASPPGGTSAACRAAYTAVDI